MALPLHDAVLAVLDSLRYHRGVFRRCILIFTETGLAWAETNQLVLSPRQHYTRYHAFSTSGFPGVLLMMALVRLVEVLAAKRDVVDLTERSHEALRRVVSRAGERPTLGDVLSALEQGREELGVRRIEVREHIPYAAVSEASVVKSGSGLIMTVRRRGGPKLTFWAYPIFGEDPAELGGRLSAMLTGGARR